MLPGTEVMSLKATGEILMLQNIDPTKPYRIRHGGEEVFAAQHEVMSICDQLVEKHGIEKGPPNVERVLGEGVLSPEPIRVNGAIVLHGGFSAMAASIADNPGDASLEEGEIVHMAVPEPPIGRIMSGEIDILGEARSKFLKEQGEASGFSFRETVYRRGMPVIALGEENARRSIEEHNAKPYVGEACAAFIKTIAAENRRDVIISPAGMGMAGNGDLITKGGTFRLTEQAFRVLLTRMGIGGAEYLQNCWPRLRSLNINHWTSKFDEEERLAMEVYNLLSPAERAKIDSPLRDSLKFRLRNGPTENAECYGLVTPSYTSFNVDRVAEAIRMAMPSEAKADFNYDGHRTSFDVLFHSNVQPTQYVAGEFFKAGIRVKASDSGDGSIIVSAIVWQNLCLNLLIIDEANKPLDRIRHIGDVHALASRLHAALAAGKVALASFLKAWDYAIEEKLTSEMLDVPKGVDVPVRFEDALPGIYNGLYERELLPIKKPKETIPLLVQAWGKDTSFARGPTRAAIVNSITRYAHEHPMSAAEEDKLETAAGALLTRRAPKSKALAALPYAPF